MGTMNVFYTGIRTHTELNECVYFYTQQNLMLVAI